MVGASPRPASQLTPLRVITDSVFRLAARRTELCAKAQQLKTAPVIEKRVGLSRVFRRGGLTVYRRPNLTPVGRRILELKQYDSGVF
jgi:hypothetical protein